MFIYFVAKGFLITYFIIIITSEIGFCSDDDTTSVNDSKKAEASFRKLYKLERAEQLAAVKALLKLGQEEKQRKMVEAIAERVFSVIQKSRTLLENYGYVPGESLFPSNESARDALSNILENTAFYGDIVLRLPDISQEILQKNPEWNYLLKWSVAFTNQTKLVDSKTDILLSLVNQEMNYTARQSNFTNPYRKSKDLPKNVILPVPKKENKKKKKIPRGPRLSRQTGDL